METTSLSIKQIITKKLGEEIFLSILFALIIAYFMNRCPIGNWYLAFLDPKTYEEFSDLVVKFIIGVAASTGAAAIFGIREEKEKEREKIEWEFRSAFAELLILSFSVAFLALLHPFIPILFWHAKSYFLFIGSTYTLALVFICFFIMRRALKLFRRTIGHYNPE